MRYEFGKQRGCREGGEWREKTLLLFFQAAADVVCRQLGYEFGSVATSPCGTYGGSDMCGSAGSRVAMASLACKGGELDIEECSSSEPDETCLDHSQDSIVYCGVGDNSGGFAEGTVRLLGSDNAPSIDGAGRLEIFRNGAWGPVCSSGFTVGAAAVACKAMGFAGVDPSNGVMPCANYRGENFCGNVAPHISEVACGGQETDLLACPHEESDATFCASTESFVLHCTGHGDTTGRPRKANAPHSGA